MSLNRREFMQVMGMAAAAGMLPGCDRKTNGGKKEVAKASDADVYNIPKYGNCTIMHITDCHAQLLPIYFREPNVNLGVGPAYGQAPHIVGEKLLQHYGVKPNTLASHAYSFLDFDAAAKKYGKVGGFAHLQTLVKKIRAEHGPKKTLLLDGGDTWQGSGTAYWTRGKDMVGACNLLGVDVMTGHWEFTYLDEEVLSNIKDFKGDFVANNIYVKEEAAFDYEFADFEGFNADTSNAFHPYTIKEMDGGVRVAVIGQAFPYTPIANPQRFIPHWTFGIRPGEMQATVDKVRAKEKPDVVVVISHNGMDVDLKMASEVTGIDAIFGGHTHDGMPAPTVVTNPGGKTLVTNAGSNGKFLGVMQFDVQNGKVNGFEYRLLPVFSNLLEPDAEMTAYINKVREPHLKTLREELAIAEGTMYRRGNFNGTFDQLICDALIKVNDAQISLSPGFRWGTTVLDGDVITMENVMDQTCLTYPETYARPISGAFIKEILEDVADNIFHEDPYYQQGGDMVRVAGLDYTIDPVKKKGQRIIDMRLDDGTVVEADKEYKVAGWAQVGSKAEGPPIWDQVAEYLRAEKVARIKKFNTPKIVGVQGNPGIADYAGEII